MGKVPPRLWAFCGRCGVERVEDSEKDAAQGDFAACGIVPLLLGVDASSCSTCSYSYCRYSSGKRDVGVGRAEAGFSSYGQVPVDGAEGMEKG